MCVCCSQVHSLEECPKLEKKRHRDKIVKKGICFGCLCIGHRSKDCNRCLTCNVCGQNHPSVLHITKKPVSSMDSEQSKETILVIPSSSETCGHTVAGKEDCILSILAVQVKSIRGDKIIQTYAFLDPGSTATFCSEHLMQELNINGRKADALNGVEVSGLDSNFFYSLPEVLTQR